jgi:excisionase family DNA binding protein
VKVEDLAGRAVITVEELAELFDISRSSAYEAIARGQLPAARVGRRLRVPVPALLRLLGAEEPVS